MIIEDGMQGECDYQSGNVITNYRLKDEVIVRLLFILQTRYTQLHQKCQNSKCKEVHI